MKVLLDTHAFIWLVTDDPKLSETAKAVFLDNDNEILLSAVTGFEIAVKYSLGKLNLAEPPRQFIDKRIEANALTPLPVTIAHTMWLADLPFHHRDPFDRLLVAQALSEDIPILSVDSQLSAYEIHRIW
ncbi:type II toxin-antitoxin system VapC family toxin [Methylocaldum sp.]|jgi:PIN domain nuclease of toxin-antitoxin system|uniref:type II toxin-antitoxin system VapC family toxin n=1 Tax=Methylocaldum sp. TaxID=1969727 RepID=UPI00321FB5B4